MDHTNDNFQSSEQIPDASYVRDIKLATRSERIVAAQRELIICHTQFQKALNHVLWMVKEQPRSRAPGLIVTGPTASGKTTFGFHVVRAYTQMPPTSLMDNLPPCAVMISLTALATTRGVYGRILASTNAPVNGHQRLADRELIVESTLQRINCRLLVLDEIQDILKGSAREQQRVLDAIKHLMNDLRLPILALGIEHAGRALDADPHLRARFQEIKFGIWKYDNELMNLLASMEAKLPLQRETNLRSKEIVTRILEISEGRLGVIVEIVRNAAIEAIATGKETITVDMLRPLSDAPNHRFLDGDTDEEMSA